MNSQVTQPRRQEPWERLCSELIRVPLSELAPMRPHAARQHIREVHREREREREDADSSVCEQDGCRNCCGCAEGARVAFEAGTPRCCCCGEAQGDHRPGCVYALGYDAEERAGHMATGLDRLEELTAPGKAQRRT